jgi:hypothetical protein
MQLHEEEGENNVAVSTRDIATSIVIMFSDRSELTSPLTDLSFCSTYCQASSTSFRPRVQTAQKINMSAKACTRIMDKPSNDTASVRQATSPDPHRCGARARLVHYGPVACLHMVLSLPLNVSLARTARDHQELLLQAQMTNHNIDGSHAVRTRIFVPA